MPAPANDSITRRKYNSTFASDPLLPIPFLTALQSPLQVLWRAVPLSGILLILTPVKNPGNPYCRPKSSDLRIATLSPSLGIPISRRETTVRHPEPKSSHFVQISPNTSSRNRVPVAAVHNKNDCFRSEFSGLGLTNHVGISQDEDLHTAILGTALGCSIIGYRFIKRKTGFGDTL